MIQDKRLGRVGRVLNGISCFPLLMTLTLFSHAAAAEVGKRPNIVFILSDNQAASLIGAYGNPDIKTPNIDRLAEEGIRFDKAFAVNGMCSPTRATLMTGLMPSQHGLHNWLDDEELKHWPRDWSAVEEFRTLPYTLNQNGYKTALIGKWHLGQPWQASLGYEHWLTFTSGHTLDFWNNTIVDNGKSYQVDDQHIVDFFTDKAVQYISEQNDEQPFYLQLNYDGPYVNPPTNMGPARNRFYAEYENAELASFPREAIHSNLVDQLIDYAANGRQDSFLSRIIQMTLRMNGDQATRANIASQNAIVDDGVGKVLEALDAAGLSDNTLIIYTSDQGNFYGQQGLWTHTIITTPSNLYESAMRVPLIFHQPGRIPGSKANQQLIAQYDIPGTVLDYVGLGEVTLEGSPGTSFKSTLLGKKQSLSDAIFFEQEETRGIRTQRYAFWDRLESTGQPALYDVSEDPMQLKNLFGQASYRSVERELQSQLNEFFKQYSTAEYDLWNGGVAKGSVQRPEMFRAIYGEDWAPVTKKKPAYSD